MKFIIRSSFVAEAQSLLDSSLKCPDICQTVFRNEETGSNWSTGSDSSSSVFAIVDGRIYNIADICNHFGLGRSSFSSVGEIIARAAFLDRKSLMRRIRGEFGLVLVDKKAGQIIAAVDQFGQRELFYTTVGADWLLSNDLKMLLNVPGVDASLSESALLDFLAWGSVDSCDKSLTAFRSIRSVKPGQMVAFASEGCTAENYWEFPLLVEAVRGKPNEIVSRFGELLRESVLERVAGEKLAVCMSAGLDSTSVTAVLSEIRKEKMGHYELVAATMYNEDSDVELALARSLCDFLGIEHASFRFPVTELFKDSLPTDAPTICPVTRESDYSDYLSQYDTVFTGESADNLLLPDADTYINLWRRFGCGSVWSAARSRKALGYSLPFGTGLGGGRGKKSVSMEDAFSRRVLSTIPDWLRMGRDSLHRWQRSDVFLDPRGLNQAHPLLHYWMRRHRWSKRSASVGLSRPMRMTTDPYLSIELIEYVLSIPSAPWLHNKTILREAMKGSLPDSVRLRKKVPAGNFLSGMLSGSEGEFSCAIRNGLVAELVDLSRLPKIRFLRDQPFPVVELRPYILSRWIERLPEWIGCQ